MESITPSNNPDNLIISVTVTLFMLSLITEKISNFIKLYIPSMFIKIDDPVAEKIRERKIQLLTAIIGIIVALLCNADFFILIKGNGTIEPLTALTFSSIIGCIVTGLFLSQGSKFFHDLLDTILYYKNSKKAIYNKQEIENELLKSGKDFTADEFLNAVTADQRQDEEGLNN